MLQLLKHIIIIISAATLIIASGGFSIYQHYCNCANEVSTSIVAESKACSDNEVSQSCCTILVEEVTSCCPSETNQFSPSYKCEDFSNCCRSEITFLKTDDFNSSIDQKKTFRFVIAFVNIIESNDLQKEVTFNKEAKFTADLPPPDYGKKFLIGLHQLKIATPLV